MTAARDLFPANTGQDQTDGYIVVQENRQEL
ncbi:hypothetical protein LMIY3S_00602 [Labrys miyagiensis]